MEAKPENVGGLSNKPENNLSDVEERVRLLYEQSPFAYQSLDKEGFVKEVNSAWLALLGYQPQECSEVIGKWIGEFFTPKSQEKFKKRFPKFLSSGSLQATAFEMVCRDGKTIAVEVDGKIGTDKNGHFKQTHCVLRNITSQKEAEDKLRLLSSIIHQCREGIAVTDLQSNLLFMNRSYAQMHQYEPAELLGKNISVLHNAEQMVDIENAIRQIHRSGDFKGQIGRKRKDGSVFPSLMHISLLSDSSSEPIGMVGIALDISELKQKEDELRRERDLAQKYLDIAGAILIVIGADRKVKMINKKGCDILGFSRKDIIDKDWFENFIPPQEREKAGIVFDALMKGEKDAVEYYENDVLTRNDQVRTIAWHNTILKDDSGQITGTLSSGLDVTEERKAEKRMRSQHSLAISLNKTSDLMKALRMTLKTALELDEVDGGGIYLVDEKTGGLDLVVHDGLSQQFVDKVSHFQADDPHTRIVMTGKSQYRIGSEYEPAMKADLVNEGLRSVFVIPIKHEGKVIGSLNLSSRNYDRISLASRDTAEILAAEASGVVARVKAEQALQIAATEWQKTFNTVTDAICILDTSLKIRRCNDAMTQLFNKDINQMIGHYCWEIVHHTTEPIPECPVRRMEKSLHRESMELKIDNRSFEVTVDPLTTGEGSLVGAVHIIRDITERKQAEQALQQAHQQLEKKVEERTAQLSKAYKDLEAETANRQLKEKMLRESEKFAATGRLAAGIAHEINNPLAGIKNAFLLLKDAVPKEYKYYNYVSLIEKEISRVSRIVQQMLELYRPQQESPAEFRFAVLVREIIELHKIACREHNVKIEIDVADSLVVKLPEGMIKQILFNLIDNAVKASKPDRLVKVSAKVSKGTLTFTVADNGIGIKKEEKDKIFEPFFTTEADGAKRGLGLGLPVAKSIVDAMGGSISFESEYGKGTVFTVTIPLNTGSRSPKAD